MIGSDPDGSDAAGALRSEPSRPKQTCAQCRARKVRCDGRLDKCSNCDRLGHDCSFGTGSSTSLVPAERGAGGRRVSRACKDCHMAKSRCTGTLPTCQRCAAKGIECIYPSRRARRRPNALSPQGHLSQSSAESRDQGDMVASMLRLSPPYDLFEASAAVDPGYQNHYGLLTRERVMTAVRNFFDHLHCLPSLAFLHKPSFMRLYSSQEADPALLASIVALASRLPGTTLEEMEVGFRCAELSRDLVHSTLNQPSVFRMQALLLLLRFQLWTGSSNDPLLFTAHLARSAFMLRMQYETSQSSFFVQESRRRLMWAIYMLDVSLADGLQEYTACPITAIHLRLPCMEDDFELGNESSVEKFNQNGTQRLGIIAYYIRVVHLNDKIMRYVKRLLNLKTDPDPSKEFFQLEKDLEAFQAQLPEVERFSQRNLSLRAFSPRLSRFVMTHVWWYLCHCQLFRCLLPTIPQSFSQKLADCLGEALVAEYQKKCLEHAASIVLIFSSLMKMDSITCILDSEMADCAFKTSEILLLSSNVTRHELGLGRAETLQHASTCLGFAESMLGMYPAIAPLVADMTSAVQSFAQEQPCFASSSGQQTSPKQAISKHSALQRASFTDDSYKLEMHDTLDARHQGATHIGQMMDLHAVPSNMLGSRSIEPCAEGIPDTGDSQNCPIRGVESDIWDQVPLFQGPFDAMADGGGEPDAESGALAPDL